MSNNRQHRLREQQRELNGSRRKRHEAQLTSTLSNLSGKRREYATTWTQADAAHCEAKGYYRWMAQFVEEYPFLLEIGTGDGRGTLELVRRGHRVVSIDENPCCLDMAFSRLAAAGATLAIDKRELITPMEQGPYSIQYSPPKPALPLNSDATLLAGDAIGDPNLAEWLQKIGPFDAIVCWLIGTHCARALNTLFLHLPARTPGEYRLRVQNQVYHLADRILRPGGILHIVDRAERPGEDNAEHHRVDTVDAHRDQARTTSLQIDLGSVEFTPFDLPDSENRTEMVKTLGTSGRDPGGLDPALWSIVARKP